MKSLILALHAGHNASAVIGDQSGIRFAIQEERLNGEKNFWGFPRRSIQACLDAVHASPGDLACVAYAGQQVMSRYHSREDVLDAYRRQGTVTGKLRQRIAMPLIVALRPSFGQSTLVRDLESCGLGDVPVVHHDHHVCHAATAYYGLRERTSERSTVLTCDGAGDGICATVHEFGPEGRKELSRTPWESSLGALYSWVTYILGFVPLEHEYKLMGMAPYASASAADKAAKVFEAYLGVDKLDFQKKTQQRTNDLGDRIFSDTRGMRFDHICAGLQKFTEDLLVEWAENAVRATNLPRVLAAGGVFMNVKANKRIAESPLVDYFEAFPSCGDETIPMGAYYLEAAKRWGSDTVEPLRHFYFGDDLDPQATENAVRASGLEYERPEVMPQAVVDLLLAGKPVARCAGRMEFGARALGNRSILADPAQSDVVRVINQAVKKRDFWMPFAPMVLEEAQDRFLHNPKKLKSPYMMMTFATKENFRELIAAVHNADLTCRAQILSKDQNPEMYAVVKEFERRSGRGVVLNTSFNLHGLPIVRTAQDALYVLKNSGLQHLQVGPYLVHKRPA